jgi:membrane-associated phospholipid phosphatase
MSLPFAAALAILAAAPGAAAQEADPAATPGAARPEPPGAASGLRSVYRIHLALDGAVVAVSALASYLPWALEDRIIDLRCPCDRSEVPRWERFAIGLKSPAADLASNATVALAVLVPPAADLALSGLGEPWLEDAAVLAETLAVNGAIVTAAKYSVQRPIPLAYAGDPDYVRKGGSYRSFYSGHVSTVFAALTASAWTVRLRYGERVWPWIVTLVVGASVGVERVLGGNHFPSDVLVGAAAGMAVGTAVPLLHLRREASPPLALVASRRGLALVGRF